MVTTRAGHCAKKVMQDKVQEDTPSRGSSPAFLAGKKTSTFFSDKTSHA
jgi:hypothetical protein